MSGWLGGLIGGVVGFMVGGPVGAAVGAGLGAGAGAMGAAAMEEDAAAMARAAPPPVAMALQFHNTEAGVLYAGNLRQQVPAQCVAVVHVLSGEQLLQTQSPFRSGEGHFMQCVPIVELGLGFFVPYSALQYARAHHATLRVSVVEVTDETPSLLGCSEFVIPLPPPTPWSLATFVAPLIRLCLAVAYADGVLAAQEVRLIKTALVEELGLPEHELPQLKGILRQGPSRDLGEDVAETMTRLEGFITPAGLADLLAGVARADGVIDDRELEIIRQILVHAGMPDDVWGPVQQELGLVVIDYHAVLGLTKGASAEAIKRAYRQKMRSYHPDKVSQFPVEFQRLAHEKSIEIRQAFDALMAQHGGE